MFEARSHDVRCQNCGTKLGVAYNPVTAYCNEYCKDVGHPLVSPFNVVNAQRDDVIRELHRVKPDLSLTSLAVRFDISKQRVHQILEG